MISARVTLVLLSLAVAAGCFSPRIPPCALDQDAAACLVAPDASRAADARRFDARLDAAAGPDARTDAAGGADAPPPRDAASDAPPARDAAIDARPADASLPVDAAVDAPLPVDAAPDAPLADATPVDCTQVCTDRRCALIGSCDCGDCFDDTWCGELCPLAICESNLCCFPENSPCTASDQCCAGLLCAVFCIRL